MQCEKVPERCVAKNKWSRVRTLWIRDNSRAPNTLTPRANPRAPRLVSSFRGIRARGGGARSTKIPIAKLGLALYGHPLPGAFWDIHCTERLRTTGLESVQKWGSTSTHRELRMILNIYVDDFKLVALKRAIRLHLERTWTPATGRLTPLPGK